MLAQQPQKLSNQHWYMEAIELLSDVFSNVGKPVKDEVTTEPRVSPTTFVNQMWCRKQINEQLNRKSIPNAQPLINEQAIVPSHVNHNKHKKKCHQDRFDQGYCDKKEQRGKKRNWRKKITSNCQQKTTNQQSYILSTKSTLPHYLITSKSCY